MNETLYVHLKQIKDKYSEAVLSIEGVHGIGINMARERIVVYVHDVEGHALDEIPLELDGVLVETSHAQPPSVSYLSTTHPERRSKTLYRPIPSGVSVGQIGITFGSIGAWVYSQKHKRKGFISNNHVLADVNNARKRQASPALPVTVQPGGTPANYTDFTDTLGWVSDLSAPTLNSVSPSNPKVGDVVTLNGSHFGNRKGWGKVWIGSVEMPVLSWTSGQIQVYVPDISPGTYDVKVEVEGDPITQPGRTDGASFPGDFVGELYDFVPIADNVKVDVAFAVLHDESLMDPQVARFDANRDTYEITATYPSITPIGIETRLYEQMPIWKTGRRTGTKYGYIENVSVDLQVDYGTAVYFIKDTFSVLSKNSVNYMFLDGGDSGSGVFTADRDEHKQWFLNKGTTEANYIVPPPPQSWEQANKLIGLCFAGDSADPSTGEIIKIANIMDETTGLGAMTLAAKLITVDFDLSTYTPPSYTSVDFALLDETAVLVNLSGDSTVSVAAAVSQTAAVTLSGDSTVSAAATLITFTAICADLTASSSLSITTTVIFTGTVKMDATGNMAVSFFGKKPTVEPVLLTGEVETVRLTGEVETVRLTGGIDRNIYLVGE